MAVARMPIRYSVEGVLVGKRAVRGYVVHETIPFDLRNDETSIGALRHDEVELLVASGSAWMPIDVPDVEALHALHSARNSGVSRLDPDKPGRQMNEAVDTVLARSGRKGISSVEELSRFAVSVCSMTSDGGSGTGPFPLPDFKKWIGDAQEPDIVSVSEGRSVSDLFSRVDWDDRKERISEALRVAEDLAFVDGRLCTRRYEPILPERVLRMGGRGDPDTRPRFHDTSGDRQVYLSSDGGSLVDAPSADSGTLFLDPGRVLGLRGPEGLPNGLYPDLVQAIDWRWNPVPSRIRHVVGLVANTIQDRGTARPDIDSRRLVARLRWLSDGGWGDATASETIDLIAEIDRRMPTNPRPSRRSAVADARKALALLMEDIDTVEFAPVRELAPEDLDSLSSIGSSGLV